MLTQEYVKELFKYVPETGELVWRKSIGAAKKGKIAGGLGGPKNGRKYKYIRVDGKLRKAHRVVWLYHNGVLPEDEIDHIDHDSLNNRIENLREVDRRTNAKNANKRTDNKSGVTGVYLYARDNLWVAQIMVDYKGVYLGRFKDKFEAICARKAADVRYGFHPTHGA